MESDSTPAGRWLFLTSAAFNWLVVLALVVPDSFVWRMMRMQPPEQTLFLHLFAAMVAVFGLAYFWIAQEPTHKRTLIQTAIVGKISVFAVVLAHYLEGTAPALLVLPASGDLAFAGLYIRFLQDQGRRIDLTAQPGQPR